MMVEPSVAEAPSLQPSLRIALVSETYRPEVNGVAMTLGRMVDGLLVRGHRIELIRPRQHANDTGAKEGRFEEFLVPGMPIPGYVGLRFGLPAGTALQRRWALERPDLVHVATEGPLGWSAVSAARKLSIPVSSDFHTHFEHYSRHYRLGWLHSPLAAYLRRFHNRTLQTFVPTAALARSLGEHVYRKLAVIARGVDSKLFAPARRCRQLRASWGLGDHDLAVLSVGRLAAEKNLQLTLRAVDAIRTDAPTARMIFVGDGPIRRMLESRHPDHHFAGVRCGIDLATHYASADLFLFPSLTETFGNVTLEAMAGGLAVVAFNQAAAAEVIRHRENGLVSAPGDELGFINEARPGGRDAVLRRRLGNAARANAIALHWERVLDHFAASLCDLVNGGTAPAGKPLRVGGDLRTTRA